VNDEGTPAVLRLGDEGDYLVIGETKTLTTPLRDNLADYYSVYVGPTQSAVIVPAHVIETAARNIIERQTYCGRCEHDKRAEGVVQFSVLELYPPDHAAHCPKATHQ
jgi:hypothetical protein